MAAQASRRELLVEVIYDNLRQVLRDGIRPAKLTRFDALWELLEKNQANQADAYVKALALDQLLRAAVDRLGGGPEGRATRLLFGVDPDSRGRLLKDRRRLAAQEFDVLPSTFRRNYEADIIWDLAVEVFGLVRE